MKTVKDAFFHSKMDKPTFTFFKMTGCGACDRFQDEIFTNLSRDQEVLQAVNLDKVVFGYSGNDLQDNYPDLAPKVRYAPFLWLSPPYDKNSGYHLDPRTQFNPQLNTRYAGKEFPMNPSISYQIVRDWILKNATGSGNLSFRKHR